jgi:DnaJ-domain-containing protein 1
VSYDTIKMESGLTDFIETGLLPGDAQQIGQTWRYINKDGSPDRRFSHNRPVPVARYGVFKLTLSSDLSFTLHVSLAQAAKSAVATFHQDTTTSRQNTGSQKRSQHWRTSSSSHQKRQAPPPPPRSPKSEPVPDCYTVLDLNRSCTQEEASAAYRKLAKQYHPDMVSHLATEFQRMAEEKMMEFNKAYTELKRLRGW